MFGSASGATLLFTFLFVQKSKSVKGPKTTLGKDEPGSDIKKLLQNLAGYLDLIALVDPLSNPNSLFDKQNITLIF